MEGSKARRNDMSTRCNVHVIQEGCGWDEIVQLYHHCDGYPTHMLPLFAKAFEKFGQDWRGGRTGHVAAFMCAIDPTGFEPESGLDLHGDIEFFYKIYTVNTQHGTMAKRPIWEVETLRPNGSIIHERTEIRAAAAMAEQIEAKKYS